MQLKEYKMRIGESEEEKKMHLDAICACCSRFRSNTRNRSASHMGPNLAEAVRHFGKWLLDRTGFSISQE